MNDLSLLSIVIPALDEEGCIASTVEHLHLELRLAGIPHEIVVVDDGSSDGTWQILLDLKDRISELKPLRNEGVAWLRESGGVGSRSLVRRRGDHHDGR